jgi:hypothetical protein
MFNTIASNLHIALDRLPGEVLQSVKIYRFSLPECLLSSTDYNLWLLGDNDLVIDSGINVTLESSFIEGFCMTNAFFKCMAWMKVECHVCHGITKSAFFKVTKQSYYPS